MKIGVELNYEDGAFIAEIYPFETTINSSISDSVHRDTLCEALDDVRNSLKNVNLLTHEVILSTCFNKTGRRVRNIDELEQLVYDDYKSLLEGN